MADAVSSQLVASGSRNWSYVFTNLSDGTGETNVVKVNGSSTGPLGVTIGGTIIYPGKNIKITEIEYDVNMLALEIIWDATSPQNAVVLSGYGKMDFHKFGGLAAVGANGAPIAGATGKILFTTIGKQANVGYTIYMRGTKGIPQS